jgi:hypothetical protein
MPNEVLPLTWLNSRLGEIWVQIENTINPLVALYSACKWATVHECKQVEALFIHEMVEPQQVSH